MLANAVLLAADSSLTDDIVIARILQGNKEDYEILVRRYNSQLYKTARGILVKEEDIEDVMQEAYIRGYEKLRQFRKEARFSTWLTRILINCALEQVNKLKGREHLSMDALHKSDINRLQEIPNEGIANPEVGENIKNAIEAAINHLPAKYRVVFVLREIQQTPVAEAATALGISEENVKIRLHRAKTMLKDMVRSELNSLEIFVFHDSRCALMAARVMIRIQAMTLLTD